MTSPTTAEELIANLEATVAAALAELRSAAGSPARVGEWGLWEVAAHFSYWHQATAWGIESANGGGPPWPVPSGPDPINATTVRLLAGEPLPTLLGDLEATQRRLVAAARRATDLERAAFSRPDGTITSIARRLELIANHWRGHLEELRAAGS